MQTDVRLSNLQASNSLERSAEEQLLKVTDVSFRYGEKAAWLFRDLSLELTAGEILSILGPNARGKTTLLKCLAGLLAPVSGTIETFGQIGYVPQDHGAGAQFLVRDMVLMGRSRKLRPFQVPGAKDKAAAQEAMERIGVQDWADKEYSQLSGGQRQLVLIARAVATGSRILVLDEPASALDLRNQGRVLQVLSQLASDGMAVAMTTHHLDHALHVSRNSLLFVGSEDTRWGPTETLFSPESLSNVYGLPISIPHFETASGRRSIAVPDFGPIYRSPAACTETIIKIEEHKK